MAKIPAKVQEKDNSGFSIPAFGQSESLHEIDSPVFESCPDGLGVEHDSVESQRDDDVKYSCSECEGTGVECGSCDGCCGCVCHWENARESSCRQCLLLENILILIAKVLKDKTLSATKKLVSIQKYV